MKLYNKARNDLWELSDVCMTVTARYGTGGGNVPIVLQRRFSNIMVQDTEIAPTIEAGGRGRKQFANDKCGCTPQGWKPGEQLAGEFAEALQELPLESSQASEALLNMWCNGKGLWLLQQALYSIQKIRESTLGERTGGGDAMTSVVRRLTPLE